LSSVGNMNRLPYGSAYGAPNSRSH
jgi:hypothetical protein